MEDRLVPYEAVTKIEGQRVLVLAPHPDDEVFGCGGAIMRHVAAADAVRVVVASDGEYRAEAEQRAAHGAQRREESRAAGAVLGYGEPEFWALPDRGIEYGEFLVRRIAEAIAAVDADLVYAPSVYEMHPDHRALGMAAVEAVRRCGGKLTLAMYEVGVPMTHPNRLVDITDLYARKQAAMACFISQLKEQPYDQHIAALNRFRTYTLPSAISAAEAYFVATAEELKHDALGLFESEYGRQNKLGLPMTAGDLPKVSVLIRSMNRPQLQDALDSLALQTYPNIEVVVINARREEHRHLGAWCGRFPLRVVSTGKPLMRSPAANVGLANADGDFLLFLDDDDWLAPGHIAALVAALKSDDACRVAYAGVELRGPNREPLDVDPMNEPFDVGRLYGGNYIPIHAILFARTLLVEGLRFDDTLDVYEDWDFLLQLARLSGFVHVDEISAYYRATGTSGVGVQGDDALIHKARERIFEKWKPFWSGAQIDDMVRGASNVALKLLDDLRKKLDDAVAVIGARDAGLKDMAKTVRDLERRLEEKDRIIQARDARLHDVFHSTSWRVSAPVRWGGMAARKVKRGLKRVLRRLVGIHPWPAGVPDDIPVPPTGEKREWGTDSGRPFVSVIMPVYNACRSDRKYFLWALESIAGQTYRDFELIVVDDGSTDDTRQVYEEFVAAHPDLKTHYFSKENGGQSSARNFGVRVCSGNYVGFIDQDDEWYRDKLEQVVPYLGEHGPDVIYTDADIVDGDDKTIFGRIHQTHRFGWPHPKRVIEDILFKDIIVMPGLMTIRKEAYEKVGGFDENLSGYEDDDLFLRLFESCDISYLPEPTLKWRMYGDNYSFSHRMLTSRTYYWKKLLKNYTDGRADVFRVRMISQRFFWQFLNTALEQYEIGKDLYGKSLDGAREIVPFLPKFQRALFSLGFRLPEKYLLPVMGRFGKFFRAVQ